MMQLVQSPWTAVVVGAAAFWTTTYLLIAGQHFTRPAAVTEPQVEAAAVYSGPSWDFRNPEVERLVAELRSQRDELSKRERDLREMEARLNAERQEITSATQAVWKLRMDIDNATARANPEETARLKKLAKVYASMQPEGAAKIFKEMDEDQAARILAAMSEVEAASVLESLGSEGPAPAKRAAALADRLRLVIPTPSVRAAP